LGGNYLSEVIIRNLPNLRQLIISYNNVKNLVIENCQQLDHIYDYKSSDLTRITQDGKKYDEKTDNPFKNQEGFIHVEDELRAEANKKKQQFLKDLLILILDIEKDTNEGK
jgi:replicative DNA helicase